MRPLLLIGILGISVLLGGCSTTIGSFKPATHFTYPNSNVRPLGHISISEKEGRFLFPPELNKEKILKLMNDGLTQKPGADMITNYRIDTTYTMFPFYTIQTIKLEGEAVDMEVGEQDLLEKSKYE